MVEEWKDIAGYEGLYQVSNLGRVKGVERISPQGHLLKEKIRALAEDKYGYMVVNLCRDGKVKVYKVHRLVCYAFISKPLDKDFVNHIDGDKKNNAVWNLEWCTSSENIIHAFNTGLKHSVSISRYGESNAHCKLTNEQVELIRKLSEHEHKSVRELSKEFGVGYTQIYRILKHEQRDKEGVVYGR